LLNAIPFMAGGAGGHLERRTVSGIASEPLCRAISRFEDKYFPGQRSGYVDPGGGMLKQMLDIQGQPGRSFSDFHITKSVDSASPRLF
jgi:hypothetical protein